MTQVILPREKVLTGGTLHQIATDLNLCGNTEKDPDNGNVVYKTNNQEYFEDVLTHDNVMLIATEGGNILNYIMYAKLPYSIEVDSTPTSIYEVEVPEGLQYRTIKITDGTQVVTMVKKLGQWANAQLSQTFSTDYDYLYVLTNPLGSFLSAVELKIFVDGFSAQLLTRKQYSELAVITE